MGHPGLYPFKTIAGGKLQILKIAPTPGLVEREPRHLYEKSISPGSYDVTI